MEQLSNWQTKKAIDTAQKYCIRAILKAPRNSPIEPFYKLLRIMKFTKLRKFELCKLAYSVKERLSLEPIIELFNSCGKKHIDIRLGTKISQILKT